MAKPTRDDIVSIEAHISYQRDKVRVRLARQWYTLNNVKHPGRVRVWLISFDVPLLDDDLIKILASAVLYAGDPNKRHLKPPRARFWREAGMELPVPPGGGEGGGGYLTSAGGSMAGRGFPRTVRRLYNHYGAGRSRGSAPEGRS